MTPVSPDVLAQLTPEQLFDALAVRIDGPRCWDEHVTLDVDLTDVGTRYRLTLRNGVLSYTTAAQTTDADAVLHLPATALPAVAAGAADPAGFAAAGITVDGDPAALGRLLAALDAPDPTSPSSPPDPARAQADRGCRMPAARLNRSPARGCAPRAPRRWRASSSRCCSAWP